MKIPAIQQFDAISDKARESVYALVLKHFQKHPNSPWSGRYLVELENAIKKFYQDLGVQYQGAFRDTLPEMMKEFYDRAKEEIRTAGGYKAVVGEPDPKKIKYFLNNSFEQVAMRTDKMSFDHIRSLRQLSADVLREVSLTGRTRKEVSKAMLDRALQIPGFEFTDVSGRKWSNKSYFNMLARTELMNASRSCYDDKMADEGFDVMRLTVSGNSCDKCARFENRLFSLTGATAGLSTKADLEDAGVFHPNCTHSYVMVPDFIRERDYNADGTKKEKQERQGEVYQATQQRAGNSLMVIENGDQNFPSDKKYKALMPIREAALKGEDAFIEAVRKVGFHEDSREFAAVWNEEGKLHCVAMGKKGGGNVQFEYPLSGAKIIHNHPHSLTPSWRDFEQFVYGNIKEMQIITQNGVYSLTQSSYGAILNMDKAKIAFNSMIKERNSITFAEWEKIINGSKYRISYRNS